MCRLRHDRFRGDGFRSVHQRCHAAWKDVLGRVEIEAPENRKRMAYTALYTKYANIIDGSDGSCYAKQYSTPRSLASSAYWQFIGGFPFQQTVAIRAGGKGDVTKTHIPSTRLPRHIPNGNRRPSPEVYRSS